MAKLLSGADVTALIDTMTIGSAKSVSAVTDAAEDDCEITTSAVHGLVADDLVAIYNTGGAVHINGVWYVVDTSTTSKLKISTTKGGTAEQGNDETWTSGGSIKKISSDSAGLTPGDLEDIKATLKQRPNGVLADNNRAAESTIKTILGI